MVRLAAKPRGKTALQVEHIFLQHTICPWIFIGLLPLSDWKHT